MRQKNSTEQGSINRSRAIISGSFGNFVEWYDFYAYAYTALYFAPSFFPGGDRTAQLLSIAAIYAVGFFIRPLGGWYFGRLADRTGRRAAMVYSVLLMGAGAFMISILPDYSVIGSFAPAGLLIARVLQGFSTGGQYGAAATYLAEMAPADRRGRYASLQYVTIIAGQLLAIIIMQTIQLVLTDVEIRAWAWRLPFLIGSLLACLVFFFRKLMPESLHGETGSDAGSLRALACYPRAIFIVAALSSAGSICLYTFTTYMQKFLVNTSGLSIRDANRIMLFATATFMLLQPIIGGLSDRIGRRRSLIIFCSFMTIFSIPIMRMLAVIQNQIAATILIVILLTILSFYSSISGLFKAELFPARVRALGVGLIHSVAAATFGGTAELLALEAHHLHLEIWFYAYVSATCLIALISLFWMNRTIDIPMDV